MGRSKKRDKASQPAPKRKFPSGIIFVVAILLLGIHGLVVMAQRQLQFKSCDPVKEDSAQYAACRDTISYWWVLTKKPSKIFFAQD